MDAVGDRAERKVSDPARDEALKWARRVCGPATSAETAEPLREIEAVLAREVEPLLRERDEWVDSTGQLRYQLGQANLEAEALRVKCAALAAEHHAQGKFTLCPHCTKFYADDEAGAMENARLRAELAKASDGYTSKAILLDAYRDMLEQRDARIADLEKLLASTQGDPAQDRW